MVQARTPLDRHPLSMRMDLACRVLLGLGLLSMLVGGCAAAPPRCRRVDEATAARSADEVGPVLFVMTAASEQRLANGKTRPTGFFLGEFFEPYRAVREAGFRVAFASPAGRPAVVDPESLKTKYWKEHPSWLEEARALVDAEPALRAPMSLASARAREDQWSAMVVPGGQGVMIDLLADPDLPVLLTRLGETGRPVGLVCHAPMLLTRLARDGNPFAGRAVTSVSGTEEFFIETFIMGGDALDRGIGDQLAHQGYRHRNAWPGQGFAQRDGMLITSQNPYSGEAFVGHWKQALQEWRQGSRYRCDGEG